jgi:hypothetical protein
MKMARRIGQEASVSEPTGSCLILAKREANRDDSICMRAIA